VLNYQHQTDEPVTAAGEQQSKRPCCGAE